MLKNKEIIVGLIGLGLLGGQSVAMHHQQNVIQSQKETIAQVKESNYNLATGKKTFKLADQQHIKTNKFDLQFVQDDGDAWGVVITPNNKSEKVIGQQGLNAQGLEVINVPNNQDLTTTPVNTGKMQGNTADKVKQLMKLSN